MQSQSCSLHAICTQITYIPVLVILLFQWYIFCMLWVWGRRSIVWLCEITPSVGISPSSWLKSNTSMHVKYYGSSQLNLSWFCSSVQPRSPYQHVCSLKHWKHSMKRHIWCFLSFAWSVLEQGIIPVSFQENALITTLKHQFPKQSNVSSGMIGRPPVPTSP